ncbi:MAG: hypothetical protein DWQ30_01115 [Acidobacteria bacterium]|nr:MAG: hypothetical protein DWQ30_01115 [Acidobacteriota bacterium]
MRSSSPKPYDHTRPGRHRRRTGAAPLVGALVAVFLLIACGGNHGAPDGTRVIILGFDGMDPELTQQLVEAGRLPNFARLIEQGHFQELETSVPPQSPVAWSNFVTGRDSGGHGIFDFIHRDPKTLFPLPAGTEIVEPENPRTLELGKYCLPLGGAETISTRQGTPFWQVLEERGVETSILRMPANYPPSGTASRELTGMGTPDLNGTDGQFSFYTSELFAFAGEDISGGEIFELDVYDNVVEAKLYGAENPFLCEGGRMEQPFRVFLDPESESAKIELGDQEAVIGVGEWTDWLEVEFELAPLMKQAGIVRMYLRALEPEFELYTTPIDYDPMDDAAPIAHPPGFAAELAEGTGRRFYTEGMPEDTKAYTDGVFTLEDFLAQIEIAGSDQYEQYPWVLDDFMQRPGGLMFYYVGNVDLTGHVMWRTRDAEHPHYDAELDAPHEDLIPQLYERLDQMVGLTLDRLEAEDPNALLVVMSDHGFTSWRNTLHLNAWLAQEGYLVPKDPDTPNDPSYLTNIDWSQTRAYGVGLSGLYVNLAGREREGIVPPADRRQLMHEIRDKLLAVRHPETGEPAVTEVWLAEDYLDRGALDLGPDIQVGYARHWHGDNDSALGSVVGDVFSTNDGRWTGDHIMDHREVPGVLMTNRALRAEATSLRDLAGVLLLEFGIEGFPFEASGD